MSGGHSNDSQVEEVTPALGRWVAELDLPRLPAEVIEHMKRCILDAIGCGLYGSAQPWGKIASEVATELSGGAGSATLFGSIQKVSPADAALANGTAVHGFEVDDVHVSSSYHPGSVTLPTALAIAEARSLSGRDFLLGMVAGYEVGIRVGICGGISHSTSGFHVTGTVGAVGAAAAAARLLGLDPVRATHSIGIGATQAAGLYSARLGAMAKRFHAGRAAQSGVVAGYLAERGFTGSTIALEAPFGGFMSALHGQHPPASMLEDLGERWETSRVGFKPYAACASTHTTVDALHQLMSQGLSVDNLEHLTVRMSKKGCTNVGWPYIPGEIVSAQMNGYYTAAVKLLDGEAFIDQYRHERMADPYILELIQRMEIVHDPELDAGGAAKRHAVKVEARLKDGKVLDSYVEQRRGSVEHPLTQQEVEAKFQRLAGTRLESAAIEQILELVSKIEQEPDLQRLAKLLR